MVSLVFSLTCQYHGPVRQLIIFETDSFIYSIDRSYSDYRGDNVNYNSKKIIELKSPINHNFMIKTIEQFLQRYDFIQIGNLGTSIFERDIPIVKLGNGEKKVIYIGSHHGSEWITSGLLLRFINEYCELYKSGGNVSGILIKDIFDSVELNIVPMLNPDGVELSINGVTADNVFYQRLIGMNNGSNDFSHWQANGRGVDLNHNYNFGFLEYKKLEVQEGIEGGAATRYSGEYPESEPESGYLCNYLRFYNDFVGAVSLHTQGEEIYYKSGDICPPGSENIAKYISGLCQYSLGKAEGMAAYGGFTDWFVNEFNKPSFTMECGKGNNPLPINELPMIYIRIRRVLFELPLILCRNYRKAN